MCQYGRIAVARSNTTRRALCRVIEFPRVPRGITSELCTSQCHNNAGEEADSSRAICSHWPLIPVESDLCSGRRGSPATYRARFCRMVFFWRGRGGGNASFSLTASDFVYLFIFFGTFFWLAYLNLALICPLCCFDWSASAFRLCSLICNPSYWPFMYSGMFCLASAVTLSFLLLGEQCLWK